MNRKIQSLVFALFWLIVVPLAFSQNSVQISEVVFLDQGSLGGTQDLAIDLVRGTCGALDQNGDGDTSDPGDFELESFHDTLVTLKINNQSSTAVRFSKLYYRLPHASGKLRKWLGGLAPVSPSIIAPKTEGAVSFFVFKADGAGKKTFRPALPLTDNLGFQDISLRLEGRTGAGRSLRISETSALSFGNEDRCSN